MLCSQTWQSLTELKPMKIIELASFASEGVSIVLGICEAVAVRTTCFLFDRRS